MNICKVFEAQYVKGQGHSQDHVTSVQNERTTEHVCFVFEKRYGKDFEFCVRFDSKEHPISCDCKKYSDVEMLCCHALRMYNAHCVKQVPVSIY